MIGGIERAEMMMIMTRQGEDAAEVLHEGAGVVMRAPRHAGADVVTVLQGEAVAIALHLDLDGEAHREEIEVLHLDMDDEAHHGGEALQGEDTTTTTTDVGEAEDIMIDTMIDTMTDGAEPEFNAKRILLRRGFMLTRSY